MSSARETPAGSALLIIDMISTWDFPDADKLAPQALAIAPALRRLKQRCKRAGVPVIHANDNLGRWRSDMRRLVAESLAGNAHGARITAALQPEDDDYVVLKPRHSAFFATPLELLLQDLLPRRLILTGVSSDQCVMATAADARMRDYDVVVPRDCVASQTALRGQRALEHFEAVLKVPTTDSRRLRLNGA